MSVSTSDGSLPDWVAEHAVCLVGYSMPVCLEAKIAVLQSPWPQSQALQPSDSSTPDSDKIGMCGLSSGKAVKMHNNQN